MKQNGVVCWPGPALLFFIFRFEYLISGSVKLPGLSRNGPLFPQQRACSRAFITEMKKKERHSSEVLITKLIDCKILKCSKTTAQLIFTRVVPGYCYFQMGFLYIVLERQSLEEGIEDVLFGSGCVSLTLTTAATSLSDKISYGIRKAR